VVKAFNSILAARLVKGGAKVADGRHALPIAGDDPEAVELVAGIVHDCGLEPVDAGRR